MKSLILPETSLKVSQFSFGTASLHHLGSIHSQVNHLQAALSFGFTHFDTSPLYGFGCSEISIGKALLACGQPNVTVATKVGLYAPGGSSQSLASMKARKLFGKVIKPLSRPIVDWSLERAKTSLDASFKRLQRERIDIVFLHEPVFEMINTAEWLNWLEGELSTRVGYFGLAGSFASLAPFIQSDSALARVIQINDSLEKKEANIMIESSKKIQFTYGYFSSAPDQSNSNTILTKALERNRTGSIVVFTKKPMRLQLFADISDQN